MGFFICECRLEACGPGVQLDSVFFAKKHGLKYLTKLCPGRDTGTAGFQPAHSASLSRRLWFAKQLTSIFVNVGLKKFCNKNPDFFI